MVCEKPCVASRRRRPAQPTVSMGAVLKAINLKKSFRKHLAVDDVSLSLGEGESVGLLGPNGAGKSTTIAMLSTLMPPDSGDVVYRDHTVLSDPSAVRRAMGVVPQEIALYPELTAHENLEFFAGLYGLQGAARKSAIDDALELVGLTERRKNVVKQYSGGMKRRLNVAAALLHDPRIVIMDEPTVGIDPQSRNHILETVRRLNHERGLTVLYTSHYMEEVEDLCDRVYIMDHGKVIAAGTLAEVRALAGEEGTIWLQADSYPAELLTGMEALPGVARLVLADDGVRLAQSSAVPLSDLFRLTEAHGVTVTNLSVATTSLEDVFLHLTGRTLRD